MGDITLGAVYRDPQTGIVGVATAVTCFQYGCERVTIEWHKKDDDIEEITFDAPRLTLHHGPSGTTRSKVVNTSEERIDYEPGGGFLRRPKKRR